jgi:hypothetical protein
MDICRLLSFGLGGHSEHYCSRKEGTLSYGPSTLSGYADDWEPRADVDYARCVVIDTRQAVATPEGYKWVFTGPLCSPDLSDSEVNLCPEPSPLFAGAVGGLYLALLAIHGSQNQNELRSLDSVSPERYAEGWRKHGARIGRIVDGRIVWDE